MGGVMTMSRMYVPQTHLRRRLLNALGHCEHSRIGERLGGRLHPCHCTVHAWVVSGSKWLNGSLAVAHILPCPGWVKGFAFRSLHDCNATLLLARCRRNMDLYTEAREMCARASNIRNATLRMELQTISHLGSSPSNCRIRRTRVTIWRSEGRVCSDVDALAIAIFDQRFLAQERVHLHLQGRVHTHPNQSTIYATPNGLKMVCIGLYNDGCPTKGSLFRLLHMLPRHLPEAQASVTF
eukprot:1181365-Prorocentrum_minimum.AAC.5